MQKQYLFNQICQKLRKKNTHLLLKKPLEKWRIPQQPWRKGEKLTLAGLQKIVLGMNVAKLAGAAQQPLKEEEEEEKSKFRRL